jgi:hypothetical protein
MNHEMGTPLNTILGPLDLLMDTYLDGEQLEMVSITQESSSFFNYRSL